MNVPVPATDVGKARGLDLLMVLTGLIVVVMLAIVLRFALATNDNTAASRQTDELAACRAIGAAAVQDATSSLTRATVRLDLLTNVGLEATVRGDAEARQNVAESAPQARADVATALDQLDAAVSSYANAVAESIDDPDAFLADCQSDR